jgi:hypothetical protein
MKSYTTALTDAPSAQAHTLRNTKRSACCTILSFPVHTRRARFSRRPLLRANYPDH